MGRNDHESDRPLCRKCGKPVEGFIKGREFRRGNVYFFESQCHSENERIEYWPLKPEGAWFVPLHAFPADRPPADLARADNPDPKKNVLDIQDDLIEMPEWKRLFRLQRFGVSIRLFERNAQELQMLLQFLAVDSRSRDLGDIRKRAALDQAIEEVQRLLHNFVASVFTLVDHARAIYRELYEKSGLFPDYQAEVTRRFGSAPLIHFVHDLRNLTLHARIPAVSYDLMTRRLALRKSNLVQYKRWTARSEEYLASAPAHIDLSDVVEAYANEVRAFYRWMEQRQCEIHAADVAAIEKVYAEGLALLAQEIPGLIESDLANWTQGAGSLQNVFGFAFSPEDWVELSKYESDLVAWTDAAISLTQERFGSLPAELVARIREAAAQSNE